MSGPSIRDLKAIVESYNVAVEEEYEIGGMKEVMAMWSKDDILGFMRDYDLIGDDAVMDDETYAHFADQYAMRDVDDMDGEDWYGFLVDFLRDNKLDGVVGEDNKPYATMKDGPDKYLFRKDNKQKLVGSADNEPEDGEEELEETDMDKFIREMQIAAGIVVEDGKPWEDDEEVVEEVVDEEESCDEEVIEEDCDDPAIEPEGGCSPFTHADDNVDMVREEELDEDDFIEDLLLAPKGDVGPGRDPWQGHDTADYENSVGDEDDRIEPELDRQTDFDAPSRFDGDDSDDMFDDANTHVGREFASSEFGGEGGNTHVGREFASGEMTEEPNDDDRIIDVGDDEDYETYDFDNEFENMLGGSSDMPEAELQGGMYEMNDLRRLAGLEQIMEEECDEEEDCDDDKEELDEIAPVIAAVARGAGAALANAGIDKLSGGVEEDTAGSPVVGDLIAYEVDDETAYYVMADVIGNELDFGPEDEILVPAARNDQVLVALDQQGFVKGKDFWVAGEQFEAELQNGYNDRQFSDGQDYFPKGATSQPATDLGPTAGDKGDNPMSNKMRSVEKDAVYEAMKLAYRRHRKA